MTTTLTNFIKFDGKRATGNIASLAYDIAITAEPFTSPNPKAPLYQVFGFSPRGNKIQIGGIWEKENQSGGKYLTLSVNTGHGKLNANLGRYAGQDDDSLLAIIPWD